VLALGAEKLYDRDKVKSFMALGTAVDIEEVGKIVELIEAEGLGGVSTAGSGENRSIFMDFYAALARYYMREHGAKPEHFGKLAVKSHYNGSLNPHAQYRERVTLKEVMDSPSVAYPLTRLMCAPISDGAAAAVIGPTPEGERSRFVKMKVKTFSEGRHLAQLRAGGSRYPPQRHDINGPVGKFRMDGKAIFKAAARHGDGFLDDFFAGSLPQAEWRLAIPHQTSVHGVSIYSRKLGFREDQVFSNLADHGNCVSASIPMALHDAVRTGRVQRGDPVLLLGTAAGLSLGAVGLVW